jgi:hypothetical protein
MTVVLKTAMIAAALLAAAAVPALAAAQEATPVPGGPLPPDEPVLGRSVGEWAARWGMWTNLPGTTACGPSEDERLWFLPGVAADEPDLADVRIPCALPAGRTIFVPIVVPLGAGRADCEAQLEGILESLGGIGSATLAVDGEPVPDLDRFRIDPEPLVIAEGATPAPVVAEFDLTHACGYAALLGPLPAGDHDVVLTIETGGETVVGITHEIAVEGGA